MKPGSYRSFSVTKNDEGKRIDKIVRKLLRNSGLGSIYSALRKGKIRVSGKKVKPSYAVAVGDTVEIEKSYSPKNPLNPESDEQKSVLGAYVIFENDHILAVNKPKDIAVHGPNSLEHEVRRYLTGTYESSLSFRPGPLHRLDKQTTGVLLFGKSLQGAQTFSRLLRDGQVRKTYIAVVEGNVYKEMHWDEQLSYRGESEKKRTVTDVLPLLEGKNCTLCRFSLTTGRHHQVRYHSSLHRMPLLGDGKYGGSTVRGGYILHALRVTLPEYNEILGFHSLAAHPPEETKNRLGTLLRTNIIDSLLSL